MLCWDDHDDDVLMMLFCVSLLLFGPFPVGITLGLCLVHSPNGKSVSWSESGARPQGRGSSVFHRLSVHVRRQAVGQSQTAVIRPLTNASQPLHSEYDPGLDTDHNGSQPNTKVLYNLSEEGDEGCQSPCNDHGTTPDRRDPASYSPARLMGLTSDPLDRGQVDTLSSNIRAFDEMLGNRVSPAYNPLSNQLPLPLQGEMFSEEGSEMEALNLIHGFLYDSTVQEEEEEEEEEQEGGQEELAQSKLALLAPPSPFRDSLHSGRSIPGTPAPDSEPNASQEVTYAPKQSSFTL